MTDVRLALVGPAPRIAVEYAGAGPLVVFLHGIGGNRGNWSDQLQALSPNFTACAWDARGYGDSDGYAGPLDFADFSHDLVRVLDFFGAVKAHLVGLSLGGRIARDFYFRARDRVATLTLCNTTPGFNALTPEQVEAFVQSRAAPLRAGKTLRELAPELAHKLIGKSAVRGAYERLVTSMANLRPDAYIKTVEASVAQDRHANLESIDVPTHVITSDEDTLYAPSVAEAMAARIPGAVLTVINRAGHLSNLEQPAAFNAAVSTFLLRHASLATTARSAETE